MGTLDILAERHRRAREEGEAPLALSRVRIAAKAASAPLLRVRTRIPFLDAALGGGFGAGSLVLAHGCPGSGKSTLMGQACANIRGSLYVSAEESEEQMGRRFVRLGASHQMIVNESDMATALTIADGAPLVVIDSISEMQGTDVANARLAVKFAQQTKAVVVMICHETKEGIHAGPRQLEHIIDVTLQMTAEPRLLIVQKNRFGPAGIQRTLNMTEKGFV